MRRILWVSLVAVGAFAVQALADEAPPSAEEERRATVFATVGSERITVGELEDVINARSPYARKRFAEPEVLKTFADDQAKNELFYQGAEKLGYAEDPDIVAFLDQTIVQLFVRKEFEATGTARRNPIDPVKPVIGEELAIARALRLLEDKITAAAEDKIEQYLVHN